MGILAFKWKVTGVEEFFCFRILKRVLDSPFSLGLTSFENFIFAVNMQKCVTTFSDIMS